DVPVVPPPDAIRGALPGLAVLVVVMFLVMFEFRRLNRVKPYANPAQARAPADLSSLDSLKRRAEDAWVFGRSDGQSEFLLGKHYLEEERSAGHLTDAV